MQLMPIEEYCKIEHTHAIPYIYRIEKGKKLFLYLGSKHSFDPTHPQFTTFKEEFEKANPQLVLTEGTSKWKADFPTKEDAAKRGEMSFLSFLAKGAGIPVESFDTTLKEEISMLSKKFSREEILAHHVLRSVWYGENVYLAELKEFQELGWEEATMENIKRLQRELCKVEFDPKNTEFYMKVASPTEKLSVINEVSRELNILRDTHMIQKIFEKLDQYDRIVAVVGASHTVMQEPAIRAEFGRKF